MEYRENRDARRPFLSTPDSRVYFPASAIERARRATARCLRRSEGVALVIGATGSGKTLLTRVLAAEFEAESLVAVVSPTRRVDAKSFWQQFLFGLRQTFCGCDETELRLMALDYLERSSRRRCVLLIDDAQNLPFRVFDELRSFVDQGAASASQVCVALFGTPVLEERLNLPPFYPFQQRIVSRSYLDAFERSEIAGYIDREAERVGGGFRFLDAAKRKVADLSEGSPRIANQLCDRALFLSASEKGKKTDFDADSDFDGDVWADGASNGAARRDVEEIDAPLVERAWANLLNLPEEERKTETSAPSNVVEFGTLDDEDEDYSGFNVWSGGAERFETETAKGSNGGDAAQNVESALGGEETGGAVDNNDKTDSVGDADNVDGVDGKSCENDAEDGEYEDNVDGEKREDEENGEDGENEEDGANGEIDAELEARLLQNLTVWETAQKSGKSEESGKRENDVENAENTENVESVEENENVEFDGFVENAGRGDRWERADELKERIGAGDGRWTTNVGALASLGTGNEGGRKSGAASANVGKSTTNGASGAIDDAAKGGRTGESASPAPQKTEERVFEALKSEYFDSGFLFDLPERPETRVDERKGETTRKPRAKTRRPLPAFSNDDEKRLFDGETTASADDERFWEMRTTARNVARRSVSDAEAAEGREKEFVSPEDLAYEQIVDDCFQTARDCSASDEYLNELSLLEQEIAEEANLIRRIRNIHLKLRSARAGRRRRNVEEKNGDAARSNVEKAAPESLDELDDAALNF